jgi:acyl-CoA synthetase (AMP-forming)/AMP-acid ligase II
VEALPKTATGKILKKNLRKKYWADETIASPEFARRK